jgi:hypothetical protein
LLFTPNKRGKPDPKGPSPELIAAIIEMKQRNRQFGCRRIAEQLSFVFEVDIDKDLVRRVLAKYYYPNPGGDGPSWLTFLGHSKDSLWNVDLVRGAASKIAHDGSQMDHCLDAAGSAL